MTSDPADGLKSKVRMLGHYAIQDRVGKGAMAVVYRAIDQRSGREVALKVMASDLEGDSDTRERFFREAMIAAQLRHPNVVSVIESGEDDSRMFLAMELLSGCTLAEFLRRGEIVDLETRIDIMLQVCHGLIAAHRAGIFHRDIKPANLFLCQDHLVKILDFGVARLAGSNFTVTGCILGTPDFMSPEQARGKEIDERSDIFSAAGVFYLMLTGRKPFAAADLPAVIHNVLRTEPVPILLEEAPEELAAVVHKGLSKDPNERQQNVSQLASELMSAAAAHAASTRQAAAKARTVAEYVVELTRRRGELGVELRLPEDARPDVWQSIVERYPMLAQGPATLGVFPIRAAVVRELDAVLRSELAELRHVLSALEAGHSEWQQGVALVSSGNLEQAAGRFVTARRLVPSSTVIAGAAEACVQSIEEHRDREARLQSRLALAREAAARHDWEALRSITTEIVEIDPGHLEANQLRAQASRSIEAARERHARERAHVVATSAINEARRAALEGRFDAALAALESHLQAHPETPGGAEALEDVRREQRTAEERGERLSTASRLAGEASELFASGDLTAAEDRASKALTLNPEGKDTRLLLERIRTSVQAQRARDERARNVDELIARADQLAARNNTRKAIAALDKALELHAGHQGAADRRALLVSKLVAYEQAEQADNVKQRQLRAAAPALREARKALGDGDVTGAKSAAERALAHAPGAPEVVALLEEIAAKTTATTDDTVVLSAPDDGTVRLAPVAPSLSEVVADLRDRASTFLRRWHSPRG